MPALVDRRFAEVAAELRSLDLELQHWKDITSDEAHGLRRHHSQVRRLAATLQGLTASVEEAIKKSSGGSGDILRTAQQWEENILAAHSIWEVFRSKLVLREDQLFGTLLAACDDLAWECYSPAMQRFAPDRKGPPLVYLATTWSPFAVSRDSNFQNEVRGGPRVAGVLGDDQFQEVMKRLPIPLVAVPWYHTFHLPGALLIAHEAGHIVASDFDLDHCIEAALRSKQPGNLDVWKGWASEIFADLYGCLCMGPPFVGAMIDLLASAQKVVQSDLRLNGNHPPRALRVEVLLEALVQTGHSDASRTIRSRWEDTYGALQPPLERFQSDVPKVVEGVFEGPYRGVALTTLVSFPPKMLDATATIAESAADGFGSILADYDDPRQLFAAAEWLHARRQGDLSKAYMTLATQIVKKGANQFRFRGEPVADRTTLDVQLEPQEDRDRESGRELADYLAKLSTSAS